MFLFYYYWIKINCFLFIFAIHFLCQIHVSDIFILNIDTIWELGTNSFPIDLPQYKHFGRKNVLRYMNLAV